MLFPALVTDLCQLSCLRTHSQVSSADQTLSYESHPRPTLLLGSMYIWTLLAPSGALVIASGRNLGCVAKKS